MQYLSRACLAGFCLALSCTAVAQAFKVFHQPLPAAEMAAKLHPAYKHPDPVAGLSPQEREQMEEATASGSLQTLPFWQGSFSIENKEYHYSIVGGNPQDGGTTTIQTVIIPIKLTFSDYSEDGKKPLVLDATPLVPQILNSPIFRESDYLTGYQQFGDAMLRAEFPTAASDWHTILQPVAGPTLDLTIPAGAAKLYRSTSGRVLAVILADRFIDQPIARLLEEGTYAPNTYTIFVTYNSLEHDAFGYHTAGFRENQTEEDVYAYTSWLNGVDDLLSIPSPDAATMSHEVAETLHDAFLGKLSSVTLLWGDPFNHNRCFQRYIEVGDAVEDAPAKIQLHEQVVGFGRHSRVYTLQNEALLQWFERKTPSDAIAGAYSFPDIWVLPEAAPLTCVH